MVRSLWTAATGMIAQQNNVDTIANNLANVNTTGAITCTAKQGFGCQKSGERNRGVAAGSSERLPDAGCRPDRSMVFPVCCGFRPLPVTEPFYPAG